jgi:Tfp pilus assembly protein FimV
MIKLTCPVCDRQEIEDNICPNCETDLSLIRQLQELPVVDEKSIAIPAENSLTTQPNISGKLVILAILILVLGFGLGAMGTSLLSQKPPSVSTATTITPLPELKPPAIKYTPKSTRSQSSCGGFYYTVKRGDSLNRIAAQFYGRSQLLSKIVAVNPTLKGRESSIEIGEVFFVPNLEENCP